MNVKGNKELEVVSYYFDLDSNRVKCGQKDLQVMNDFYEKSLCTVWRNTDVWNNLLTSICPVKISSLATNIGLPSVRPDLLITIHGAVGTLYSFILLQGVVLFICGLG